MLRKLTTIWHLEPQVWSSTSISVRYLAFDGLRGVFALLVVVGHIPAATFLRRYGYDDASDMVVDFFFVLSGFVIVAGYEEKLLRGYGTLRFLIERLGRIYPIHFVMLVLFVLTEIAVATALHSLGQSGRMAFDESKAISAIFTNLVLIQGWHLHDHPTWNFPTWSLSTEWATYIIFAVAVVLLRRRFLAVAVVGLIGAAMVLAFVAPHHMDSYYDFGVFRSILGFSAGALAYYAHVAISRRWPLETMRSMAFTAFEISGMVGLFLLHHALIGSQWAVVVPPLFAVMLVVFAYGRGAVSALMASRVFVYFGTISLSIYVVHVWLMMRADNVVALLSRLTGLHMVDYVAEGGEKHLALAFSPLVSDLYAFALLAGVVLVSHFTHRFIELPGQARFKGFARRFASDVPNRDPVVTATAPSK
jgi:peptidoglycan/LPS O-acetylase OafA/YrhL